MSDDPNSLFRKESLERLSSPEQLDQLIQIVSPKSWLPLVTLGSLVSLALIWSIWGRIPVTATGQGVLVHPADNPNSLVSVAYFPAAEGSQIRPGMELILVPNAAQPNSVSATVKSVAQPSLTTLEAARQAKLPIQEGAIEVLADLPSSELTPGTLTTARIVLTEKPPIAFVLPF